MSWLRPSNVAEEEELQRLTMENALDPDVSGFNFFVFGHARHSSYPGAGTVQQTLQSLIMTINSYSNFLNNPANQNIAEGQRPGGINTMQTYRTVVVRHGTRPVPTHTGNVVDPMLLTFIAAVNHVTRPQNPYPPMEIHFLLLGIAGFSVGLEGWGDRTQGFFRHILLKDAANNTNYAGSIYLVFVMERSVVDPNSAASINSGLPAHGARYLTKQIVKVRWADMVDRHQQLKTHALTINRSFRDYMAEIMKVQRGAPSIFVAGNPAPIWAGGANAAAKLDRMIMAMCWEHDWRSGWLDATTAPTDAMVSGNNHRRNTPM